METTSSTTTTTTQSESQKVLSTSGKVISAITSFRPTKLEVILFLSLVGLVIFLVFFKTDTKADENKRLTTEIKQIQKQKDSIANNIVSLEGKYKNIVLADSVKYQNLLSENQKLVKIENDLSSSLTNLSKQKSVLDEINNKIKLNEATPDTKVGDDLLNSLKSKLN